MNLAYKRQEDLKKQTNQLENEIRRIYERIESVQQQSEQNLEQLLLKHTMKQEDLELKHSEFF